MFHILGTAINKEVQLQITYFVLMMPDEEPTDESDVEGVEEDDQSSKLKKKVFSKNFEMGFSSSTIQIRSKDKGIQLKTGFFENILKLNSSCTYLQVVCLCFWGLKARAGMLGSCLSLIYQQDFKN